MRYFNKHAKISHKNLYCSKIQDNNNIRFALFLFTIVDMKRKFEMVLWSKTVTKQIVNSY